MRCEGGEGARGLFGTLVLDRAGRSPRTSSAAAELGDEGGWLSLPDGGWIYAADALAMGER